MLDGPEIWEFLMWVVPLVVSVIQAVRQPIVEDVIHRSVDALCDFVSGELGRLWRFARQKKPQSNIGEEGGIPLGPWGGKGGSHWAYKVDVAPILQITLRYGSIINSILITSKSRDGNVIGCSDRFGGRGGEYTATVLP
ncbi:hypothetical protein RHSIM_Rhsim12G0019200 [Rhododendron simsii]|uniref:Jacalin-type lectin domain-containing protein n=1 Tax=Rhododendron simsii TaxID=118357 RepID=A0A834G427_RHOSS|nr:hypothetical protein RHSIM_Rhsim12G0019200 [Rhododendron simsii]